MNKEESKAIFRCVQFTDIEDYRIRPTKSFSPQLSASVAQRHKSIVPPYSFSAAGSTPTRWCMASKHSAGNMTVMGPVLQASLALKASVRPPGTIFSCTDHLIPMEALPASPPYSAIPRERAHQRHDHECLRAALALLSIHKIQRGDACSDMCSDRARGLDRICAAGVCIGYHRWCQNKRRRSCVRLSPV